MDIWRREFNACLMAAITGNALALPIRPKLLVLLLIEQLRPDLIDEPWSEIGLAGLRRVLEKGAYFPDCRHLGSTFPASTVATLATGTWPSQHGIVADSWYGGAGNGIVSASEEELLSTTLAAQVAAECRARVYRWGSDCG